MNYKSYKLYNPKGLFLNKDNLKKQNNQDCNEQSFLNRSMRRSKAFKKLEKEGDNPALIYDYFYKQKKLGTIAYNIFQFVLFLSSKGMHAYPSIKHLQARCIKKNGKMPHEKSISRVTKVLADLGFIRKWNRGFKRSVALLLNPFFNNPILQYMIAPLFAFMAFSSFQVIYPTLSDCREGFDYRNICLFTTHVTYNKYKEFIYNNSIRKRSAKDTVIISSVGFEKENHSFVSNTVSLIQNVSTARVQAHGVDRKEPQQLLSMSSKMKPTMDTLLRQFTQYTKPVQSYIPQEPKKTRYAAKWYNPDDPFATTRKVLSEYDPNTFAAITKTKKEE